MGKATTKNTSGLGLVRPQERSLRSRRRGFPGEKNTETNSSTSAEQQPCLPLRAQQDTIILPAQPEQTEEQAKDSSHIIASTSSLVSSTCAEPVRVEAMKEADCEISVLTCRDDAGVLENLKIAESSKHQMDRGEEVMEVNEHSPSSPIIPMDHGGSILIEGEDDEEGCASLCHTGQLEEENDRNEGQRNKCRPRISDPVCKADNRDCSDETVLGMPAKRRKRMGMCGLTEKERSHYLQTQKRENGNQQRGAEERSLEGRGCTENHNMEDMIKGETCSREDEANCVAEEGNVVSLLSSSTAQSIKVGPFTKPGELEKEPLPAITEAVYSSEAKAYTAVTDRDECRDTGKPIDQALFHSEVKTDDLTSPSKDHGQGPIGEVDSSIPTESAGSGDGPEIPKGLMEDVTEAQHLPTPVPTSSTLENLVSVENNRREINQTSKQPMDSLARTPGLFETVATVMFRHGAQPSHSFMEPGLGGSEMDGKKSGTDSAPPSGADENDNGGTYDGDVSSPVKIGPPQAGVAPDPFGFGTFDDISESQLHNINLIEAQGGLVAEAAGHRSSHHHEDATDLVHGLIRELSSLNRIVMAAQRNAEKLRRGTRGPKGHTG